MGSQYKNLLFENNKQYKELIENKYILKISLKKENKIISSFIKYHYLKINFIKLNIFMLKLENKRQKFRYKCNCIIEKFQIKILILTIEINRRKNVQNNLRIKNHNLAKKIKSNNQTLNLKYKKLSENTKKKN